jgi:hypothetical protein
MDQGAMMSVNKGNRNCLTKSKGFFSLHRQGYKSKAGDLQHSPHETCISFMNTHEGHEGTTVCISIVQSLFIPALPAFAMGNNPHPDCPFERHLYRKKGRRKWPIARISIPIPLQDFLYRGLKKIRDGFWKPASPKKAAAVREPNLESDRDIEWT